jgi:hypothetical protein
VSIKPKANILTMQKPISRTIVSNILRHNPRLDIAVSDFSENKIIGYRMLVNVIMEETKPIERLKSIWADGQFDNNDFVKAMIKVGIDGLEIQTPEGYKHYVIYNKDILEQNKD